MLRGAGELRGEEKGGCWHVALAPVSSDRREESRPDVAEGGPKVLPVLRKKNLSLAEVDTSPHDVSSRERRPVVLAAAGVVVSFPY